MKRLIRWIWILLAVVAVVLMRLGDRAAYMDSDGLLHESVLVPMGLILLGLAFIIAMVDLFTSLASRRPS